MALFTSYTSQLPAVLLLFIYTLLKNAGVQASIGGLPCQPPAPSSKSVSTHVIDISWTAPSDTGAGITGYNVQWHVVGKSGKYLKVITRSKAAKLSVTPYTEYDIQVRAYNEKGDGPWSQPLRVRSKESVPFAAPGNFNVTSTSSLSLDVSWDAIPEEQWQGRLLGYHVYYKIKSSAIEQNKTVVSSQLPLKLPNLEYKVYSVRVAGYTAVGVGKSTDVQNMIPKEGDPTRTTIVLDGKQAQVKDNSSLVVIILASSTAVLFVTLLIFAGVFIFWRRKQREDTGHVAVNRENDPDGSSMNPNNAARQLGFVDGADTANNEHGEESGYAMLNPRTMTVPGDNCYASIENESDKRINTNEPSTTAAIPWLRRSLDDEEPKYVNQTPFSDYENI